MCFTTSCIAFKKKRVKMTAPKPRSDHLKSSINENIGKHIRIVKMKMDTQQGEQFFIHYQEIQKLLLWSILEISSDIF